MHKAPAYDEIIQGASGLMSITGPKEGPSMIAGSSIADCSSALVCFGAIMIACFDREKNGRGCHVDTSMLESLLMLLTEPVSNYSCTGIAPPKLGNDHPSITPFSSYATGGQEIVIALTGEKLWKLFCKTLEKEEWLDRPEFGCPEPLHTNKQMFREELEAHLKTHDHNYWVEKLSSAGVPVSLVNTVKDTCNMEHLKARGFFVKTAGHWYNGNPIRLSTYPRITERPAAQQLGGSDKKIRKEFAG
jgi:CoA:oxalate CoA-transferase